MLKRSDVLPLKYLYENYYEGDKVCEARISSDKKNYNPIYLTAQEESYQQVTPIPLLMVLEIN